jgi:hypothetical protein
MARKGQIKQSTTRDTEERAVKWRKYPHLLLVVCEDESTEPYYFRKFKEEFEKIYPNEKVFLRPVGTGRSSKGVVEQAIAEKQKLHDESNKDVDEVWAVFDKDDADSSKGNAKRFEEAFEIANQQGIEVAYSNEVFELWLLLHFKNVVPNNPLPRASIYDELEENINKGRTDATQFVYNHGKTDVIDIVLKSGDEQKAIERAENLDNSHVQKKTQPIDTNPNTKVYLLVKKLRELIVYYSS